MSAPCRARVDGRQAEGVADGDLALHSERRGAVADQLERERAELARFVEVDVDADLVALGEPEHDVEVFHRVSVEPARIEPADQVGAGEDRGIEQLGRAPVADDPRLRKRHDLQMATGGVRLASGEHALEPLELGVGVDLRVTAHDGGADAIVAPRVADRPRRNVTIGAPVGTVVLDQARQPRTGGVPAEHADRDVSSRGGCARRRAPGSTRHPDHRRSVAPPLLPHRHRRRVRSPRSVHRESTHRRVFRPVSRAKDGPSGSASRSCSRVNTPPHPPGEPRNTSTKVRKWVR